MTKQKKKTRQPISSIESELVTALEFVCLTSTYYLKTTDKILTAMDLNDEAFREEMKKLGDAVGYDFDEYRDSQSE
jgi:hypothetical protein